MTILKTINDETIAEAAERLSAGELVCFPTETVYGLGANALSGQAVAKIFEAKNRPSFNPLIVHVADKKQAEKYAVFNDAAQALAGQFWPGPLTLILPRNPQGGISDLVTAGLDTVAIRVPAHPGALKLLKKCGLPVAAPSANASGEPSATTPQHVIESLKDRVPFILAGGACTVGLESTVLDLTSDTPFILRPGAITPEDFAPVIGNVAYDFGDHDRPRSPGQLIKHYAPSLPVRLNAVDIAPGEALLSFGSVAFMGIRGGGSAKSLPDTQHISLSETGDLYEAAARLFAGLRHLDCAPHTGIAVMNIPDKGVGVAINDRLKRAAQGR
ncbi:MAG: threonylcarbamoyl-AMP synthase [Alphaproteobacteria bacterium]|nr:threonylcarbamoyl-AMP synthase [Alphaproteobacteria bacterium]